MIIEKDTEEKICASLAAALKGFKGVKIEAAWAQSEPGGVKGEVSAADRIVVAVAAGSPQFESFTLPTADIPVAIAVAVRRETDADGAGIVAVMSAISDMLLKLQNGDVASLSTCKFRVDGVRLDSGDAPRFTSGPDVWAVERTFTVRGSLLQ